jgi:hypothetical protein
MTEQNNAATPTNQPSTNLPSNYQDLIAGTYNNPNFAADGDFFAGGAPAGRRIIGDQIIDIATHLTPIPPPLVPKPRWDPMKEKYPNVKFTELNYTKRLPEGVGIPLPINFLERFRSHKNHSNMWQQPKHATIPLGPRPGKRPIEHIRDGYFPKYM